MRLETRLQRLEAKHSPDDNPILLAVSNEDEAEKAAHAAAEAGRSVLIVITGVPRPPESYSWRSILAAAAERGGKITDPPIKHAENWRTYHGPES